MHYLVLALGLLVFASPGSPSGESAERLQADAPAPKKPEKKLSDSQIKRILIDESIAAYSGSCPCPYHTDSRGRSCGRRSAYSREGGASPLCYPKDVSKELVQAYRDANQAE